MTYKKKWIIFGILSLILIYLIIQISSIQALGSSSSLGGSINIPMGNQTFPSITTNNNTANNNTTNQNQQQNNVTNNLNENQTTTSNKNTQTNSDENNQKSVSDFKKSSTSNNQNNNYNNEIKTAMNNENNLNEGVAGFDNKNSIAIILMINTLGLFSTLITLITYDNSLEEKL